MFDTKPSDLSVRMEIEKRIINATDLLRRQKKPDCSDTDSIWTLRTAWLNLSQYYKAHEDFVIDIEVVRDYLDGWETFLARLEDEHISKAYREELDEALMEIKAYMDDIITAVNRRRYPDGW